MTNNPRQPLNTLPRTMEQLTSSCCILWSLRWHHIFKLYRIYAKVNECIISETDHECSEYVTIGAKLCVFHVLLCSVTICLKYKKKKLEVLDFFFQILYQYGQRPMLWLILKFQAFFNIIKYNLLMLFFVHIFHEINLLFQNNCKSMLCVKQYDTIQYAPISIYLK